MPREIAHYNGDLVECNNGHLVAVFARTVYVGEMISSNDFAFETNQHAEPGDKIACKQCGAPLNMDIKRA